MMNTRRAGILLAIAGLLGMAGMETALAQTKGKVKGKVDPKTETKVQTPTGLTFEVYKDSGGKYRWRLKDAEGTNLGMAPKGYDAKADCQKGIEAIKAGAARAKVEDLN
jgi:uncharacterized protein YegP (UPF0339 family)